MAHRPAHDPAQHIAAALVRRRHPVCDQERRRAQVVGDHPVAGGGALVLATVRRQVLRRRDQIGEQIGVEYRVLALQDRGDPLQTHAGVDRRFGQVANDDVVLLLELHEDVVPDLHEPVAVLVRRARRAARHVVAVVVEDLGAGPARPVVAHGPEVVRAGDADDLVVGEARHLLPDVEGLVVVDIDGDQEPVGAQAEVLGHQLPGPLDGVVLEIVAEGEVPQHLEEGQVPRGVADVVQVVVLAPGAHALLRAGGARRRRAGGAREIVLERHHAGVDEEQRRIVLRHQRRRVDLLVSVLLEEVEEGRADVVQGGHAADDIRGAGRKPGLI